jgi:DnaJ-domain-containing protein 1
MKALATTFVILLGLLCCNKLLAFQSLFPRAWNRHYDSQQSWGGSTGTAPRMTATSRDLGNENDSKSFLLDEFCTYAGEVVDPYQTLKVSRDAQRSDIRQAYLGLSKRYHPDGVRHRDILPGKW